MPDKQAGDARPKAGRKVAARRQDPPTLLPAADRPVARIAVDIPLAHLDRPFDYLVPERLAAQALPGVRVRVRFAGQLTDGFVLDRTDASEHPGRLAWLDRVVSPERVLTHEIAGLARAVADRYAGTLADVLRLAVPPRHAATEAATAKPATAKPGTAKPAPAARPGAPPTPQPTRRPRNPAPTKQAEQAERAERASGGAGGQAIRRPRFRQRRRFLGAVPGGEGVLAGSRGRPPGACRVDRPAG